MIVIAIGLFLGGIFRWIYIYYIKTHTNVIIVHKSYYWLEPKKKIFCVMNWDMSE